MAGKAGQDDSLGIYSDPEDAEELDFTEYLRLRRIGKQLYAACQAEILMLDGRITGSFRPDPDTNPDDVVH